MCFKYSISLALPAQLIVDPEQMPSHVPSERPMTFADREGGIKRGKEGGEERRREGRGGRWNGRNGGKGVTGGTMNISIAK